MKRVGYIFESIVEMENLKQAFLKACHGKRLREDCQRFQSNLDKELISRSGAATNASRPRCVSANAYLPHAMHECDRFDLSRARIEMPNAAKHGKRRESTTNRIGRTLRMPKASADQLIMTDGFGVSRLQKYGKKLLGEKE